MTSNNTLQIIKDLSVQFDALSAKSPPASSNWEKIYKLVRLLLTEYDSSTFESRSINVLLPGHRSYDAIVEDMFESVFRGISREALVDELFSSLIISNESKSRTTTKWNWSSVKSVATAAFCIESTLTSEGWQPFVGIRSAGVNDQLWNNYANKILPSSDSSSILNTVIRDGETIELSHSSFIPNYEGEFNILASRVNKGRENGYWLSAFPLITEGYGVPQRALFLIFPNVGDDITPKFPAGTLQEVRLLHFVGLAYRFLKHRLDDLSRRVSARRNHMIFELSPGILHHEIGQGLDLIRTRTISIMSEIQKIVNVYDLPELESLYESVEVLAGQFYRLYSLTDAFNNLERIHPTEIFNMDDTIDQALMICNYRLARAALSPDHKKNSNIQLNSDAGLLLLVITNIVTNACDACEEGSDKLSHTLSIEYEYIESNSKDAEKVRIQIQNDGPEIRPEDIDKILLAGYTRRTGRLRRGHGQGLHICTEVAQYLGGELKIMKANQLKKNMTVGFEITVLSKLANQSELDLP